MQTPPKNSASAPNNWSYYDQQYAGSAASQQAQSPAPPFSPRTANVRPGSSRSRRPSWVKWGAVLAFILLLAALGSSSLFAGSNGGAPGQPTRLPTPLARSTPTTQPPATATAGATPSPTPTGGPTLPLPAAWTASGRGIAEAIEAKDVAETFVSHYETLDWRSKNTFDQATFAMTAAALTRFWQQDERANPAFLQNFINTQSVWVASIESAKTQVIKAEQWGGHSFFAWLSVTYQQYHQQEGGPSYTDEHTIVVLMVAVPFGVNGIVGGIGWEVSAWQDGGQTFPIPNHP